MDLMKRKDNEEKGRRRRKDNDRKNDNEEKGEMVDQLERLAVERLRFEERARVAVDAVSAAAATAAAVGELKPEN
jgi:hypothetical protein